MGCLVANFCRLCEKELLDRLGVAGIVGSSKKAVVNSKVVANGDLIRVILPVQQACKFQIFRIVLAFCVFDQIS